MKKNGLQRERFEALKAFNNTIVTSRLYPPEAPQVTAGIDRGYKGIKQYLRKHGALNFTEENSRLMLCGVPLSGEEISSFPNLVIYRQLQALGTERLTIGADMDRFAFRQLIKVFNTPVEKIRKEGGGRAYITGLGLSSFFPEAGEEDIDDEGSTTGKEHVVVKVRQELLACFLGGKVDAGTQRELEGAMEEPQTAVEIISAAIGHLLLSIRKKKEICASPTFPAMLQKAETMVPQELHADVAFDLARFLVESLKETALCVLLGQNFGEGFGERLYGSLLTALPLESLGEIIVVYREKLAKAREKDGEWNVQQGDLGKNFLKLLESPKGRQYLHAEKARDLIRKGEQQRKIKRVEAGIKGLLDGRPEVLRSEELRHVLAEVVHKYLKAGRIDEVRKILTSLNTGLQEGTLRGQLLECSLNVGEILVQSKKLDLIDIYLQSFQAIVGKQRAVSKELRDSLDFLQQLMQKSWEVGENARADGILYLFHQLRSGELNSATPVQILAGKIQDGGIVRSSLPRLLAEFLAHPEERKLGYRLVLQGPVAIRFLVESLIHAEDGRDRMHLIDLLTGFTKFLPQAVHERLDEHMSWYGKRNLIKLLGESGAEEDAEKVLPYLGHDDLRVQREAFLCIFKISGSRRKKLLLEGLDYAGEPVKIQIVSALTGSCDPEVASKLVSLMETQKYFSENHREDLLCQILETLGRCPCPAAQAGVQKFLDLRKTREGKKLGDRVWEVAEKAREFLDTELKEVKKKYLHAGQLRKNALKRVAKLSKLRPGERVISGLPQEQQVRRLLRDSQTDAAGDLLLQLIERVARQRNFGQADKLREWLIEIDSTALKRIIQAAEIIEAEKIAAIDRDHLAIWSTLYDALAAEEVAAVYHAMRHRNFEDGDIIIRQGQVANCLFFINSGAVKLYYESKSGEALVNTMHKGEIFGAAPFFEASRWTLSFASVGKSEISILRQEHLKKWAEEFPGLETKLQDFCLRFETIEELLKKEGIDRRQEERHNISGRLRTVILDSEGRNTGVSATVEMGDISRGGTSYLARIARKENVRLLLGRKVRIQFPVSETESMGVSGDIMAVRSVYAVENEYSVHVRFDENLTNNQLRQILESFYAAT